MNLDIDSQIRLLHQLPKRAEVRKFGKSINKTIDVNVIRNEAIEPTLSLADKFLNTIGVQVNWILLPYDDTLSVLNSLQLNAHATLIWLDWRRITFDFEYFKERVLDIFVTVNENPIFILDPIYSEAGIDKNAIRLFGEHGNINWLKGSFELDETAYRDKRLLERNGTDLSNFGSIDLARALAFQHLSSLAIQPIKCLVVDLDNTLYKGVLGEDSVSGIQFSEEHLELYKELMRLKQQGVFLAIATKNLISDVYDLFEKGPNSAISKSHFSKIEASWGDKSDSILNIANHLNIGLNSVAFLDDNPAEIHEVTQKLPEVYGIFARGPREATKVLRYGPRTSRIFDTTGGLRVSDSERNSERKNQIKKFQSMLDLHKNLTTKLEIQSDKTVNINRVEDLFARTNQFNLTLRRTTRAEIIKQLADSGNLVITASLKDRFADSGVIAAALLSAVGNAITFHEFVISCRALGRSLETSIFLSIIDEVTSIAGDGYAEIKVEYRLGPKNQPAMDWLKGLAKSGRILAEAGVLEISRDSLNTSRELQQLVIQ